MKKARLVLISAVILFSLINISLVKADYVWVKVDFSDTCPVEGAWIKIYKGLEDKATCIGTNNTGYCDWSGLGLSQGWYIAKSYYPDSSTLFGDSTFWVNSNGDGSTTVNGYYGCPSGYCVDGYCCDSACSGNCDKCNVAGSEGTCTNVNSECTGNCDYCSSGNCAADESICESTYKCSDCTGSGNSFSCTYDNTENEDCSATSCPDSCNIDSNPFTWDYANDVSNYCSAFDTCTNNQCNYQHACADADIYDGVFSWESIIRGCTAECDQNSDCQNKCIGEIRYYSGSCLGSCTCSWSTENCDNQDGCSAYDTGCEDRNYYCTPGNCDYTYSNRNADYNDSFVNYCSADTIRKHRTLHDFYCSGTCSDHTSWVDDQLVQNCSLQDGWYNTTNTQWVSSGECTEKEQKQQEYRDYTCSAAACTYSVTGTQWIDTGNTRNKPNGTSCNDGLYCTVSDTCTSGVCGGSARDCSDGKECTSDVCNETIDLCQNPNKPSGTWCGLARDCPNNACIGFFAYLYLADGHDTCNSAGTCVAYSCASTNHYCTDNDHLDGIDTLECGAQCDQNSDCPTGVCTSSCTCASDSTPPTINVLSPQNITYKSGTIQLTFTLSEPATWCVYSLDGSANKTIWSCSIMTYMTLFSITPAPHNIVVYAKDVSGNVGASNKVYFTANYSFGGGGSGCGFRSCLMM